MNSYTIDNTEEMIALIKGTSPPSDAMNELSAKCFGFFSGSYGTWEWDVYVLEKLSFGGLLRLYEHMRYVKTGCGPWRPM